MLACVLLNTHLVAIKFDKSFSVPGTSGAEMCGIIADDGSVQVNDTCAVHSVPLHELELDFSSNNLGVGDLFALSDFIAAWFPGKTVLRPHYFTYFGSL